MGLSFVAIAVTGFGLQNGRLLQWDPQDLVVIMVCLWALRLSWFIFSRWRRSPTEDVRYTNIRKNGHHLADWSKGVIEHLRAAGFSSGFGEYSSDSYYIVQRCGLERLDAGGRPYLGYWLLLETVADYQTRNIYGKNRPALLTTGLRNMSATLITWGELLVWWALP